MTSNIKRLLVTGGCGFIGSSFVRNAAKMGHNIVIVDKITYASNLDSISDELKCENVKLVKADICETEKMYQTMSEFDVDVVINFAAESHVDRSIAEPDDFMHSNILGTYCLLKASVAHWNELKKRKNSQFKFHQVSTDEVYGDLPHPDDDELQNDAYQESFTEESLYKPSSPYAASKASSDHLVRAWARTYGLPVTISNCSNNFGPFQNEEKLVPKTIVDAISCNPITVYGTGQNIRDWLYVDDHIDAIFAILELGKNGETYNIGARMEYRNIDLIGCICDLIEARLPIAKNPNNVMGLASYADLITFVADRPGHDRRYAIDPTKIERGLGWRPSRSLESGLKNVVAHYLNILMPSMR